MEKRLYSLKEFAVYSGFGATKCREIAKRHEGEFAVRLGNKLFIDIYGFNDYLERCKQFGVPIC